MKKIILIVVSILLFSSCDDVLDIENKNGSSLETANVERLLNATYAPLQIEELLNIVNESLRTDIGFPGRRRAGSPPNAGSGYFTQSQTPNNTDLTEKWNAYYIVIRHANITIEALNLQKKGSFTELQMFQYAQARFIRGLAHFYLHSVFNRGEIIIANELPTIDNSQRPLSSSEDVIEFFRKDLMFGFENLKVASETALKSTVTKGFAAVILGTSYLYEKEYEKAITWFTDKSITEEYSLVTGYEVFQMFTEDGRFNSESIFELAYSATFDNEINRFSNAGVFHTISRKTSPPAGRGVDLTRVGGGSSGGISIVPPDWLIVAYSDEKNEMLPMADDSRNGVVQKDGVTVQREVSLRASAMVALAHDFYTEYYEKSFPGSAVGFSLTLQGFYKKYTNHDIVSNESELPGGEERSGKNIIVSRYADVLLMLAECYIEKSNPDLPKAVELMNQIRRRWGLVDLKDIMKRELLDPEDPSSVVLSPLLDVTNVEDVRKHLREREKPLELSMEGHSIRAIDFRRWGVEWVRNRYEDLGSRSYKIGPIGDISNADFSQFLDEEEETVSNYERAPASDRLVLTRDDEDGPYRDFANPYNDNGGLGGYLPIPSQEAINNVNVK